MQILGAVIGIVIMALVLAVIMTLPVWLLWNWVAPALTVEPLLAEIGFWQAFGLSLLCSLLFKSSGGSSK